MATGLVGRSGAPFKRRLKMIKQDKKLFIMVLISVAVLIASVWFMFTPAYAGTISWDTPPEPDILGYNIQYKGNYTGAVDRIKNLPMAELDVNDTRTNYTDIDVNLNLRPRVEYTFTVTAYDACQESGLSEAVTYTRVGYTPPEDNLEPLIIFCTSPVHVIIGE